ncbi:probable transcription factor At1g61730 isoform X2 [Mercurialis annua]|nr:probable transcription factor At1g61730 isoform X2 [Mercurialis annua]
MSMSASASSSSHDTSSSSTSQSHQTQTKKNSSEILPSKPTPAITMSKSASSTSHEDEEASSSSTFHQTQTKKNASEILPSKPDAPTPAHSHSSSSDEEDEPPPAETQKKDSRAAGGKRNGDAAALGMPEDTKKSRFERVWSQQDVVVLLQGIIDFQKEKKADPTKDFASFFHFIIKSLHFPASLPQLKDKVSKLRKKFHNHLQKNMTFHTLHSQKTFDMSQQIWGAQGCLSASNPQLADQLDYNTLDFSNIGQMAKYVTMKGLEMLHGHEKPETQAKLPKLDVADLQLFADRLKFLLQQTQLIMASYNN